MLKLIFAAILVAIIAGGLMFVYLHLHSGTTSSHAQPINSSWLSQWDSALAGTQPYPTMKTGEFLAVSYGNIVQASLNRSGASADLAMLYDANVSAIRIDLNYGPWLANNTTQIATYDYFVNNISANNKSLVIADSAAEYYRQHQLTWSQFKAAWIQRVSTIAARYHPAYYIVIKEPPWYFPMIKGFPLYRPMNVSDWVNLTEQLVAAVKKASPNTKVGVAVSGDVYHSSSLLDLNYMIAARKIPGLDFLGFDIYDANAWNDTQTFLKRYGSGGKQVWIAEAWSGTGGASGGIVENASREGLDSEWIRTMYLFAESIHAQYINPFFSNLFASYQPVPNNTYLPASFYQNRTPVFYAYKNITPITNP
jgi:hypothetical protein